jgi:hypothetical protein
MRELTLDEVKAWRIVRNLHGRWTCDECGRHLVFGDARPGRLLAVCVPCQHAQYISDSVLYGGADITPPVYVLLLPEPGGHHLLGCDCEYCNE